MRRFSCVFIVLLASAVVAMVCQGQETRQPIAVPGEKENVEGHVVQGSAAPLIAAAMSRGIEQSMKQAAEELALHSDMEKSRLPFAFGGPMDAQAARASVMLVSVVLITPPRCQASGAVQASGWRVRIWER